MILLKALFAIGQVRGADPAAAAHNSTSNHDEHKSEMLDDMFEHMKRNPLSDNEMLGTHEDIDELQGGLAWKMIPHISSKLGEIQQQFEAIDK